MNSRLMALAEQFEKRAVNRANILQFRLINLCTEADPAILLEVQVDDSGSYLNIEEAVDVVKLERNQFQLLPHSDTDFDAVGNAIGKIHPELKQEYVAIREMPGSDDVVPTMVLTVPPVDDTRHDVIIKAMDALKSAFEAQLNIDKTIILSKMAPYLLNATKEDKDAVDAKIGETYDAVKKKAEDAIENKKKKVDEAHENYLKDKAASDLKKQEASSAGNPSSAFSMKMG